MRNMRQVIHGLDDCISSSSKEECYFLRTKLSTMILIAFLIDNWVSIYPQFYIFTPQTSKMSQLKVWRLSLLHGC